MAAKSMAGHDAVLIVMKADRLIARTG